MDFLPSSGEFLGAAAIAVVIGSLICWGAYRLGKRLRGKPLGIALGVIAFMTWFTLIVLYMIYFGFSLFFGGV